MSRRMRGRGSLAMALCVALSVVMPAAGQAATEPVFTFYASKDREGAAHAPYPPPGTGFEGPCGVGIDPNGNFYVSDYYHNVVDVFNQSRTTIAVLPSVSPDNGPCALAIDSLGRLYVSEFHGAVLRYTPSAFPLASFNPYGAPTTIHAGESTGVAVDPATGNLYVNARSHIAVYDSSGAPLGQIGEGTLEDGYGLAFSSHLGTAGYLYAGDAESNTVKVYDPATDTVNPIAEVDAAGAPPGGFTSLRDAAVAVDRVTGELYVADSLQPTGYERPESTIWVFDEAGSYRGHLRYNVIDARPVGLAVDNSATATQGYVYVTSGNTVDAFVTAYTPNAATKAPPVCAAEGPCPPSPESGGSAESTVSSPQSPDEASHAASLPVAPVAGAAGPAATASEIAQRGILRVGVSGRLAPSRLPRRGVAPIAVSVSGKITTTDESPPPQLKSLRIEFNRHGRLDYEGLPTCRYSKIQPASSGRALRSCRRALVGEGRFWGNIALSGQEPYPTVGRLLVFNGRRKGKPVLFGHIYARRPFATSFVIPFSIRKIRRGTYGTALTASLPAALGDWGYVTALEMRLARRYRYEGKRHSFLSAGCPAPKGFPGAIFRLARTSFRFAGNQHLTSTLVRSCRARS